MFFDFVVARSFTTDDNLLQPTGCEQNTSHVTFFSCLRACLMMSHTTLAQVFVRVIPSMSHAPVCLNSLRPSFALFICLSHLLLHAPDLSLSLLCGCCQSKIPCALRQMRSLALWSTTHLSQLLYAHRTC